MDQELSLRCIRENAVGSSGDKFKPLENSRLCTPKGEEGENSLRIMILNKRVSSEQTLA